MNEQFPCILASYATLTCTAGVPGCEPAAGIRFSVLQTQATRSSMPGIHGPRPVS